MSCSCSTRSLSVGPRVIAFGTDTVAAWILKIRLLFFFGRARSAWYIDMQNFNHSLHAHQNMVREQIVYFVNINFGLHGTKEYIAS